jgi:hypothetical protein
MDVAQVYRYRGRCNERKSNMGRPPIGKVAMTGAERVRKHRAKTIDPPRALHQAADALEAAAARICQTIKLLEADNKNQ